MQNNTIQYYIIPKVNGALPCFAKIDMFYWVDKASVTV